MLIVEVENREDLGQQHQEQGGIWEPVIEESEVMRVKAGRISEFEDLHKDWGACSLLLRVKVIFHLRIETNLLSLYEIKIRPPCFLLPVLDRRTKTLDKLSL